MSSRSVLLLRSAVLVWSRFAFNVSTTLTSSRVLKIKPEVPGQWITSNLVSVDEKLCFRQLIYHHRETHVSRAVGCNIRE